MDRALLDYSEKFTFSPERLTSGDLHSLRGAGYTAKQVLDIVLLAGYRHYITRIANGTGIEILTDRVDASILAQYTYSPDAPAKQPGEIRGLPGDGATLGQVMEGTEAGYWVESPDLPGVGESLTREYQEWEKLIGFVPNWLKAISLHQESAAASSEFARYCTFGGSPLGAQREHLIGYRVASLLRAPYFYALHGHALKEQGTSRELLENVEGWREAELGEQDRALLDFSEQVTRNAHQVTQGKVDQLKTAGFSDSEVLDVIVLTSFLNSFCRVANALGVPLDPVSRAFFEAVQPEFMKEDA
jgi:uncharacterized peroxidase-related enzyme